MIASFLTTGKQVLILFLLLVVGFVLGKSRLISEQGSKTMSNLVMYIFNPAMLITAFQRDFVAEDFRLFGLALLLAFLMHGLLIVTSRFAVIEGDTQRKGILRFGSIFSNCGFMGYPIMLSLVGSIGPYYGSAYVITFNILAWSYGVYLMTQKKENIHPKAMILNPGVMSVVLAMGLYLLRIRLPELIMAPLEHLAAVNTPMPMLVVGYQLSHADFARALRGWGAWSAAALRLIISPLMAIGLCLLLGLRGDVATVLFIAAATPPGAMLSMFAARYDLDTSLASSVMSVQTVLSVVTIPIFVTLGQLLVG